METTTGKANSLRKILTTVVLPIVIAIVTLYMALRGIQWGEVWATVRASRIDLLLAAFALGTLSSVGRGVRWGVLVSAEKRVHPARMYWAAMIGYLGNAFLPARAGEFIRSFVLAGKEKLNVGFVLATALTERIIDAGVLVAIGAISLSTVKDMPEWLPQTLRGMGIAGGVAIALLFITPFFEGFLIRLLNRLPLRLIWKEKLITLLSKFLLGMKSLRNPRRALGFALYTAAIWLVDAGVMTMVGYALNLRVSLAAAFSLLVGMGLSSAIPSTPGYIGVYQFAAVSLLPLFGQTRSQALTFILVVQALNYVVITVWGLVGMWQLGVRSLAIRQPAASDVAEPLQQ